MRRLCCAVLVGIACLPIVSRGGESATMNIGGLKPAWRDLPGTDGKRHSLSDFDEKKVIVVAITCNHCPIAMEYFERLKEFSARHCGPQGDVALVAISVSSLETDKLDRMKLLAERESFNFPYLYDESQSIGRQLGATVTPQFFVLNQDRTLVYRGPWDDNMNRSKVKARYVEDAVNASRVGSPPPVSEARSIGCAIRYDR